MVAVAVALGGCDHDQPPAMVMENPPPVTTQPATQCIPPGRVVAAGMLQVGGRFVTAERILRDGRGEFERLAGLADESAFRKQARVIVARLIQRAIAQCLVQTEADLELPEDMKARIEAAVARRRRQMVTYAGGSEELLARKMSLEGVVLEEILEDVRRVITINEYLNRKLRPKVRVTRKMLWEYYRRHRSRYRFGKEMQLRIIAAPVAAVSGGQKEAKKLIDAAAKDINSGKKFADVAKELAETISKPHGDKWPRMSFAGKAYVTRMISDGGLWPAMAPQSLADKPLAEAAAKLEQGQVSQVIATKRCCYLVFVEKVRPAADIGFGDAQADIVQIITDDLMSMYRMKYLASLQKRFRQLQGRRGQNLMVQFSAIVLDRAVQRYWGKGK